MKVVDIVVIGAGTAGMPFAISAVATGARTLVVEQSDRVGGTLWVSAAQMSGAATKLQKARGIDDDPERHLQDILRISRNTCDATLVAKATALGGATVDWLMANGFDVDPACPAILHFHEAYRIARTYWGRDGGRSVLKVVTPLFEEAMRRPNAELLLNTEAIALVRDERGRVCGVRLRSVMDGVEREVRTAAVVLASGGYGADPVRFARWTSGLPLYTAAMPTSTGLGIEMAEAVGAVVRGGEHHLPTYAGIAEEPGGNRISWDHLPSLTPQVRPPWEIHVDATGRRFVREDIASVDARERALRNIPGLTFWAVFDDAIWREAPPLLPGWKDEELKEAWERHDSFVSAGSLGELAHQCGIDPSGLAETVARYNMAQASGGGDELGREHLPRPISAAPFRAIEMHGMVLKTAAGLDVDDGLRVLDRNGQPIDGLYALGEAIGGARLSGNAFVGGMSVTPALGFGRWLGETLGRTAVKSAND